MKKFFLLAFAILLSIFIVSCDSDKNENMNSDIPPDPSGVNVPAPTKNNVLPTATFNPVGNRIQINLLGLLDPATNQPLNIAYNVSNPQSSSIFVEEDGVVKGLKVTKVGSGTVLKADIVFLVDNSGSMDEEADSVAASIIDFANFLQANGLDAKFAVVGYDYGVNGGINFTNAQTLSNYLNRSTGTYRTYNFSGADSASLTNRAYLFGYPTGENGVIAAIFADSVYAWRSGAQRVFINFTDEPTQSNGSEWNNAMGCSLLGGKATVHTVFSEDSTYYSGYWSNTNERPWELSKCTGGTIKFIPNDAAGLSLRDLPVAGALANSYLVEYVSSKTGQAHTVKITVYTSTADGVRTYNISY
ncbi:vWA domain-containing protein [Ignavibacterium sp.]|uniref:vWA domain-containing protein n=1 Tax=Ignavibacterium sp. TaxID=2651167 RepID=UPI00220E28D1|nr:vWA domain-containing protein [Ignavibacterium sp.]BDQ03782.1 MAG: hypothetical protein KatS3mg037_2357 [Ignavibacterium sp.]